MEKNPLLHYAARAGFQWYDLPLCKCTLFRIRQGIPRIITPRVLDILAGCLPLKSQEILKIYQQWAGYPLTPVGYKRTIDRHVGECEECGTTGPRVWSRYYEELYCKKCYKRRYLQERKEGILPLFW